MENKKKKIAVYLTSKEYDTLLQSVINSNKTLTAYCKEKIFSFVQVSANEDFLRNHILRQFEDLLYLLISQNSINKEIINQEKIKEITSLAIYVGNLKAITNKKLKFQRQIEKDYDALFKLLNIPTINRLIKNVNEEKDSNKKIFLLGSFKNKIKSALK
jgi:hypothetical protein